MGVLCANHGEPAAWSQVHRGWATFVPFFFWNCRRGGAEAVQRSQDSGTILTEGEIVRIERAHPDGLTSAQIVQIFRSRGARFSEATLRKYVQLGLLPRSRRVGTKGKHRGSHGIYPRATVRRINAIKRMMQSDLTIEDIQRAFGNFKQRVDELDVAVGDLLGEFERELDKPRFDRSLRPSLQRDIDQARETAADLMRQLVQIETRIACPGESAATARRG